MSNDVAVFSAADLALLSRGEGPLKTLHPPARLAIFGDPVAHSASPPMQNAALEACSLDLQYVRIHVRPEELSEALANLAPAGFLGASLTIPHKQAALSLIPNRHKTVALLGAINTVKVLPDGHLVGINTDALGFVRAIQEVFGFNLSGIRLLILGSAGGAGRAISAQCFFEGANPVFVNRDKDKGDALVQELENYRSTETNTLGILSSISMNDSQLKEEVQRCSLIVNATPLGMKKGDSSPLPDGFLTKDQFVYDTVYSGGETALLRQARQAGSKCADGFSMLLHQGALQFEHWFDQPAPVETMRAALYSTFPKKDSKAPAP
jgi:shikimate dehydrogenase